MALWCLFRCEGAAAVGVAFVTVAVFVIVAGQSAHLSDVAPRSAAYLVGGLLALGLLVALVRPSRTVRRRTTGLIDIRQTAGMARSSGPARANAVRAAVMVAAATLLYRVAHIPDGLLDPPWPSSPSSSPMRAGVAPGPCNGRSGPSPAWHWPAW